MTKQREQWQARMSALVQQIAGWVDPEEWVTKRYPKRMRGADGSVFEVASLVLQKGPTRLLLDPIAPESPGTEGIVDLYLMPTYDDMASLYLTKGGWQIHYGFPDQPAVAEITQPRILDLNKETINQVLNEIAAHAVPSF